MNQTFNSISSEELCKKLSIKDTRSLLTTEGFPKPLFNEGEILFSKEEVSKYFNIENIDEPFISTIEAAEYLGITAQHLKNLVKENQVPSYRLKSVKGSAYLFRKSELDVFRKIDVNGNVNFVNYFVGNEAMKIIFLNYIDLYKNEISIREHEVVYEYFFNRKTFDEIGQNFDLTTKRVRLIFNKTMSRFKRRLSTKNMLNFGELERTIIQKDIEIKYLKDIINSNIPKSSENDAHFDEYNILNKCISFLGISLYNEDISVRALNVLKDYGYYNLYSLLSNFNTYKKTSYHIIKFRNLGKKTMNELIEYIEKKEKDFEIKTGVSSEEFFSDKPKTPNNLSLFSKIHANFKN